MESRFLPKNTHTLDRIGRVVLGLGLLSLLAVGPMPGWGLLGLLGFVLLATAAMGSCPIYTLLGVSTCTVPQNES